MSPTTLAAVLIVGLAAVPALADDLPPMERRTCADWIAHREAATPHSEEVAWIVAYVADGQDRPLSRLPLKVTPSEVEEVVDMQCGRNGKASLRAAALVVVMTVALAGPR